MLLNDLAVRELKDEKKKEPKKPKDSEATINERNGPSTSGKCPQ